MQFLPVSLQNGLKMCAFLRGTINQLQPVQTDSVVCGCMWFFISEKPEKPELATDGLVACGLVWSGFSFFLVHRTGPSKAIIIPKLMLDLHPPLPLIVSGTDITSIYNTMTKSVFLSILMFFFY